jgi:hypothetical protein
VNQHQWQYRQNVPEIRSFGPYPGPGLGGTSYPSYGFGAPMFGQQQQALPPASGTGAGGGAASGLLGNFNLKDIKSVVDRMGGIDGIISTMGKVQKIVSSIQQMQPMLRLLFSMLPGKAKTTDLEEDSDQWTLQPKKRRKRKSRQRKGRRRTRRRTSSSRVYRPARG